MERLSFHPDHIKAEAQRLGFVFAGITTPDPPPHAPVFRQWIDRGSQADMAYLASPRSLLCRPEPRHILPAAQSVLMLAVPYTNPVAWVPPPFPAGPTGRVASYAWGDDYHEVLLPRLRQLVEWVEARTGRSILHQVYTDTGPVLERDLAMRAGLGWTGKNTCLIHPQHGSYFLLAEVFLETALEPDPPFTTDHCGSCRRCIEACPTGCIQEDRTIDAGRCISYLTIENKKAIPIDLRPRTGEWIFGCDICQMVCPWNIRFAHSEPDPGIAPRPGIAAPDLHAELRLDPAAFKQKFRASPVLRAKRRGYLRNVAVALGNIGDPDSTTPLAETLRGEPEPLVRAHAAWALGRLGTPLARQALSSALSGEPDPSVLAEVTAALRR